MSEFQRLREDVGEGIRAAVRADVRRADVADFMERGVQPPPQTIEHLIRDDETAATKLVPVPARRANGGEVLALEDDLKVESPGLIDALTRPPAVVETVASRDRLELLGQVDAVTLGLDLAESVEVEGSLEKAIAHEIAGAHAVAMRFLGAADSELQAYQSTGRTHRSVEATRCANTAARLFATVSAAAQTLQRLQNDRRPGQPAQPTPNAQVNIAVRVDNGANQ